MKGSKRKIVNCQIFENAESLWPFQKSSLLLVCSQNLSKLLTPEFSSPDFFFNLKTHPSTFNDIFINFAIVNNKNTKHSLVDDNFTHLIMIKNDFLFRLNLTHHLKSNQRSKKGLPSLSPSYFDTQTIFAIN